VDGSDVTLSVLSAVKDAGDNRWSAFGGDLVRLSSDLTADTAGGCTGIVCEIAQSLLQAFGVGFQDLKQCEGSLKLVEADFVGAAKEWASKEDGHYGKTIFRISKSIAQVGTALMDCGVDKELGLLVHAAHTLGLSSVKTAEATGAIEVLVHGVDLVQNLESAMTSFEGKDYSAVGTSLGKVMDQIAQWTQKHSCTSDVCFMVEGVFQFMGVVEGSFRKCENDMGHAWGNFTGAFSHFSEDTESVWHWATHKKNAKSEISQGLNDLGLGFKDMASAVHDCDVPEVAKVLEALGTKLGLSPEVTVLEEIVKIVVDGVEIENEIGTACQDFSQKNWVGFGFELASLVHTLA